MNVQDKEAFQIPQEFERRIFLENADSYKEEISIKIQLIFL